MLNLFNRMPAPQIGGFLISPSQMRGVCEQLLSERCGIMFKCHRDGQVEDLWTALGQFEALGNRLLKHFDIIPCVNNAFIKRNMFAAVDHFLFDERVDLTL